MRLINKSILAALLIAGIFSAGCASDSPKNTPASQVVHPEWSKNANIYEVNIRQYSKEGTFNAFTKDLPRLKEMGVDILWLMPIHPIGEINRKGTLGSYYSVLDYKGVNPKFGTEADFQKLVDEAHALGMKVIIDWVANHTAWGHPWTENRDWFELDESGEFTPPHGTDWTDVIQLNYENNDMREAMIDALEYWVREFNIDGYRCDVASFVPTEFWNEARRRLDKIKPVFMLAEAEVPEHHEIAFDMSYAWEYSHIIRDIAKGNKTLAALDTLFEKEMRNYPESAYRMYFTSNHDENSWAGTDPELYGANFENFAVLSATVHGMPLIYNGQESGLDKRLEFFEKDEIEWKDYKYQDFYTSLLTLKKENEALWNGEFGGGLEIFNLSDAMMYGYKREKGDNQVFVFINFDDAPKQLNFREYGGDSAVTYEVLSRTEDAFGDDLSINLEKNSWIILVKK